MDILKQLAAHEAEETDLWDDLSEAEFEVFLKELVMFADAHPEKLIAYCRKVTPKWNSSLELVYEALSIHADRWHPFLLDEVKRVVGLAKSSQLAEALYMLDSIDLEWLYKHDRNSFEAMLCDLVSAFQPENPWEFNEELLDILKWFLAEYETDEPIGIDVITSSQLRQELTGRLVDIANQSNLTVRKWVKKLLDIFREGHRINPPSFLERLTTFFFGSGV
jgi:hypothetical protein